MTNAKQADSLRLARQFRVLDMFIERGVREQSGARWGGRGNPGRSSPHVTRILPVYGKQFQSTSQALTDALLGGYMSWLQGSYLNVSRH